MGGRTVISPTARGWHIRRRWRGQRPLDRTPIHAVLHRRWLVEATCLGIPAERWVWQVADRHTSAGVVEEVAAALTRDDPSPQPANAELIEHVTDGGPPCPLGHVRLTARKGRAVAAQPSGNTATDTARYLRTAEVAAILQVSPKTVTRWAKEGKLPFLKTLGGHRRYPAATINQLADQLQGRTA
jgi:excisionase family DNA binding protein